ASSPLLKKRERPERATTTSGELRLPKPRKGLVMNPFTYKRATNQPDAVREVNANKNAKFLAGGTNLVDLMKMGVQSPNELVDINRLDLKKIEKTATGLRIGALASNSDVAASSLVRDGYPVLAEALLAGASPQLRNMATVGGNLM